MEVNASAFAKLAEKEVVLGGLLGAASQVTNGQAILSLEPWLDGSAKFEGAIYRSGGIFYPGANGEALFRFVLQNVEDGSTLSYTGRLSDAGQQISYEITRRDKTGMPRGHADPVRWRLDGAAPGTEKTFAPAVSAPTMGVDAAAFAKLAENEPVLGGLLGAASHVTNGQAILSLEPWLEGFVKHEGAIYHSGAIFYPRPDGETLFRVVLQNVEDGSTLTYTGRLSDAARRISYSISERDKTGQPLGHKGPIEWRFDKTAPAAVPSPK